MARSQSIGQQIWTRAVAETRLPSSHPSAGLLLLPALNAVLDMATTRTMALQVHPPGVVYALLFGLGLFCSLLAGYRMAAGTLRSWLHILGFTLITVVVVYVTLDIEYPRTGLFRLQSADQLLHDAREGMK
jgi:multidrug transporter EmrE-like cation transporter